MSRRDNTAARCKRCRLHQSLCVCALLPTIETRTQLILMLHRDEDRKSTNTGRLATLCLPRSRMLVRGHEESPSVPFVWEEGTQPALLFPHEDALLIGDLPRDKPVTLVVPDGTWRQAFKVRKRVPGLADIPCVTLPPGEPSIYQLRAEPLPGGLATFEAIARALGILEGPEVQAELERVFRILIDRSLWARGDVKTEDVSGGIPDGVMRHDPWSGRVGKDNRQDAEDAKTRPRED